MNDFLDGLTKNELVDLIQEYNTYVIDFGETHDTGSYPVCLAEFYECEYQADK